MEALRDLSEADEITSVEVCSDLSTQRVSNEYREGKTK